MKKLVSLLLAIAMMATMSVTAFAAINQDSVDPNGSVSVTYSVAPTYTVTIPTDVTIGGGAANISAENVVVEKGKYVSVSLAADNDFTVTTAEGATLSYTVTAGEEAVAAGGEILAVNPTEGKTGATSIAFAIDEAAIQYAGIYTGTATFTIAVKDAPVATISFKFYENGADFWSGDKDNYVVFSVKEGTTWGEWLQSADNIYGLVDGGNCIYAPGPAFLEGAASDDFADSWWPLIDEEIQADGIYMLGRY